MGIKGLNSFLKKKCPESYTTLSCSWFSGKRIAIDSNNLLFKLMARAHKEIVTKTDVSVMELDRDKIVRKWLYHVKNFVIELIRVGATPIFVFDGEYIAEKSKTQTKRRQNKQKQIDEMNALKEKILQIDELERTPAMIMELRKKMQNLGYITSEDKYRIQSILSSIGIPVLTAKGEGEELCAMLCIEGKVDAAYSKDTDMIALGCPLTITDTAGICYNEYTRRLEESFECVLFNPILSSLQMEYEEFLDLCIMSGCDFNDNIPHVGIGKSFKILKECKSIDNLPDNLHVRATCVRHDNCKRISEEYEDQTECLNHNKCREIFKQSSSSNICQDDIVLNIDTDLTYSRDRLSMFGAEDWLNDIAPLYRNIKQLRNIIIPKQPSLKRSSVRLRIIDNNNNHSQ